MEGTTTISNEEYYELRKLDDAYSKLMIAQHDCCFADRYTFISKSEYEKGMIEHVDNLKEEVKGLNDELNTNKAIYIMGYTSNEEIKHWSIWDFLRKKRNIDK